MKPTQVVGKRVAAFIIDGLIVFAINAILFLALTEKIPGECIGGGVTINGDCHGWTDGGKRALWIIVTLTTSLLVYVILPGIKGWSPGKAAMGIRLVNAEGRPPGVLRAFLRYILWIVDAFPYIIPYLTGFITALNSQRNQRVGDMAAGTYVVDKNAVGSLAGPPPGGQPAFAQPAGQYGPPPAGSPVGAPPPPEPQQQGGQPADWYPDPQGQARLRYWDGQRWTEHTSA
ncbi:MAG: hypothetical protein QOH76_392 [Thermoleophilaceae bacterium]|jgi:uncharacterized RDD family membrane protein YckC|nr:hypothetical protein [Thermoleophilaceae bacterium]